MTDAIQTVADGLAAHWTLAVPYALGCVGAFSIVQSIKQHRRDLRKRRATALELRLTAAAVSAGITFAAGYWLFGWPLEVSATHAALCAVLYPVAITVVMSVAATRWPALYERLRVPDAPERRQVPRDRPGPPDDLTRHY